MEVRLQPFAARGFSQSALGLTLRSLFDTNVPIWASIASGMVPRVNLARPQQDVNQM